MNPILRTTKRAVKVLLGKEPYYRPEVRCQQERFGSEYGGWSICTEGIDRNSIVYSFGIGEDASFDIELIGRFGLVVHAFDPTPKSIEWARAQAFPSEFVLHEYGLAGFDGSVSFHPPDDPSHVSYTVIERTVATRPAIDAPVHRLTTIAGMLQHERIDILKMDIEGAEYDVLEDLARSKIRPRQILVEFHHYFPGVGKHRTVRAVSLLREMRYGLFCVSPSGEEYSFIGVRG